MQNNRAIIEGYASLFGTRDLNGDVIRRGAFSHGLSGKLIPAARGRATLPSVKMLYQHAADKPIGRWLEISETARGLYVRGEIILESPRAREVADLVDGGALDGLSIGFRTRRARKRPGGRELIDIDLWEVSIVTFPMAPGARINRIAWSGRQAAGDAPALIRDSTRKLTV